MKKRPRRGAEKGDLGSQNLMSIPEKRKDRPSILSPRQIRNLATSDPITGAILQARRHQISQCQWDIVPKIDRYEQDLTRWYNVLLADLKDLSGLINFQPTWISPKWYKRLASPIDEVMSKKGKAEGERRLQIRRIFDIARKGMKMEAEENCEKVREVFKRPNDRETSWNSLMNLVVDSLLLFDAGIIVKNWYADGTLAELYTIPPEQVLLYINPDDTMPEPPDPAYLREKNGQSIAEYTRDELVYMMANPQPHFYGFSPLEQAAYAITTSLKVDNFNLEFFDEGNIPASILNMPGLQPSQMNVFRSMWSQEMQQPGRVYRMMFANLSNDLQYIPLRQLSGKDMQMMEYLKWTLSIKCACFQISPQDIGFTMDLHRTTSEVQYRITKDRGLRNLLGLIASYMNEEVIGKEWKDIEDAEFSYLDMDRADASEQAQLDSNDLANGIISRNDRREHMGEPPLEGGDIILVSDAYGGMAPLDVLEDQAEEIRERAALGMSDPEIRQQAMGMEQEGAESGKPGAKAKAKAKPKAKTKLKSAKGSQKKPAAKKKATLKVKKVHELVAPESKAAILAKTLIDAGHGDTLVKQYYPVPFESEYDDYQSGRAARTQALMENFGPEDGVSMARGFAEGMWEASPLDEVALAVRSLREGRGGYGRILGMTALVGAAPLIMASKKMAQRMADDMSDDMANIGTAGYIGIKGAGKEIASKVMDALSGPWRAMISRVHTTAKRLVPGNPFFRARASRLAAKLTARRMAFVANAILRNAVLKNAPRLRI